VLQPYFTTPAVEFGPRLLALPTLAADTTIVGKVVGNRLALSSYLSQSLSHATHQKNSEEITSTLKHPSCNYQETDWQGFQRLENYD
jgi:hypothetical protein